MDKFENIDDLFAQLGNDERQAPSEAWEYIIADQKRKRRAGLLWWYYGTAGVLLIVGLMGYYQFKSDKTNLQANNLVTKKTTDKKTADKKTKISISNSISNNNNIIENRETPRIIAANIVSNIIQKAFSNKPIINNSPAKTDALDRVIVQQKQEESIVKANVPTDEVVTPPTTTQNNVLPKVQEDKKDKTIRKIPTPKIQKYFVEPLLMGTYNSRRLKGGADMTNYIDQRNASEVKLLSYGVGIIAGKQFSKNWNVQGGLLYNIQGLTASYTVSSAQKKVFVEVDPTMKKYDTTSNYIYIHDSAYRLEKGNAINGDQKFHYIRIPVIFEWQMNIKKTANIFYAGAGMSLNVLLAARGDIQDYQSTRSGVFVPINQVSLQRLGFDFTGGAGVLVPWFGRPDWKMSFGIRGMYSPVSAFSKEVPIKQHNYSLAFEVGVRKTW